MAGSPFSILNDILLNKTPIYKYSYLFVCSLFNEAVRNLGCIAFKEWLIWNDKIELLRREAIVAYFENQSQRLSGGESWNTSIGIMGVPAEIWNGHLRKISHMSQLILFQRITKQLYGDKVLEKRILAVLKFVSLHGSRSFIVVFNRACHLSLFLGSILVHPLLSYFFLDPF
jgi:hypothetical protein